jgi:hypothetical protein
MTIMKNLLLIFTGVAFLVTIAFGQGQLTVGKGGNHWQRFWGWTPKQPPPLSLPESYSLALARMGSATNRFFCVAASSLEMTNHYFPGWAFVFSNTNGEHARIEVSFDKEFRIDPRSETLLGQSTPDAGVK